ncbi:MAG: hypothetical protein MUC99_11850, partial [Anaerolineae bacterium]|nr:hypothetical protein [Anaerolineae bacterium]
MRPDDLTTTDYGLTLLVKNGMVLAMLMVAALHHAALHPQRWARLAQMAQRAGGYERTVPLAGVLGVAIVTGAGWLTALPVPVPPDALTVAPAVTQTTTVGAYDVTLTASPGGTGFNTFDVEVKQDGQPVDGLTAAMGLVYPALDQHTSRAPLDPLEAGLYETANADITQAGAWWALIDLTAPDGQSVRAAFALDIRAENTVSLTVPLNAVQVGALVLATVAVGFAAARPSQALYRRLGLTPQGGLMVLLVMVLSVGAFVVGVAEVARTSQQYGAAFNSPPEVPNPTLPTQASLERGAQLLAETCAWLPDLPGWGDLRARLPRTRDAELFAFTRDGFRGLP